MSVPTVVMVILVSIDLTTGGVGYGVGGTCWIHEWKARLFGYILVFVATTFLSIAMLRW